MKKLFIILTTLALASCSTYKKLPESELAKFRTSSDTIYYQNEAVAVYLNIEWEYYRGHKTMEISVERINGGADEVTDKIVDYIVAKHRNAKAEVKIPRQLIYE